MEVLCYKKIAVEDNPEENFTTGYHVGSSNRDWKVDFYLTTKVRKTAENRWSLYLGVTLNPQFIADRDVRKKASSTLDKALEVYEQIMGSVVIVNVSHVYLDSKNKQIDTKRDTSYYLEGKIEPEEGNVNLKEPRNNKIYRASFEFSLTSKCSDTKFINPLLTQMKKYLGENFRSEIKGPYDLIAARVERLKLLITKLQKFKTQAPDSRTHDLADRKLGSIERKVNDLKSKLFFGFNEEPFTP